ncbi:MAG TPA: TIGR04372 family glycosyltransferase [Gammaproteobacteria bacterium]|nr:TIGR04372 family glycosyltransferase [Gammaproteobacteria bacterium]
MAIPIACGIFFISPIVKIRFIKLFSSRIGHYSINTELILCALDMKLENDKKCKTLFYTSPGEPICNTQLHRMWKREIPILPFPFLIADIDNLLLRFGGKKYKNYPIKKLQVDCEDRYNLLVKIKKCHLSFTPQEKNHGKALMEELGVPAGASFVCLLVRDSSYLNAYMPSIDWSYHEYRDATINSYQLAANYLAEKGYYVIRMGKFVKDPFFISHSKVIDYAMSKLQSDFMDIYLSAYCFFFISTCTGLDSVARVFRKPLLVTNLVLADFDIWHPWRLFIPKKIMDFKKNKLLTLEEMNKLYFEMRQKKQIPQLMREKGLQYIDNTPEEIKDVVEEMLGKLTENLEYSENDELLQGRFWKKYPKYLASEDLQTLNIPICKDIKMRVGRDFLKNNLSLLTDMAMS